MTDPDLDRFEIIEFNENDQPMMCVGVRVDDPDKKDIITSVYAAQLKIANSLKKQIQESIEKAELWDSIADSSVTEYEIKLKQQLEQANKVIDEIRRYATHAGCMGNPKCEMCPIIKILSQYKQGEKV